MIVDQKKKNASLWIVWLGWIISLACYVLHYPVMIFLTVGGLVLALLNFNIIKNGFKMFKKREQEAVENKAASVVSTLTTMPSVPEETSAAVQPARRCTVIASESVFIGSLEIDGDIHIYGKLTGTVMLKDGILHVMRNGFIEGDFAAPNIIINGRVLGTCASEKIEILEHGEMEGIIRTSALSIRPGGSFIGSSERMQIQIKAPEPERVVKIDKKQNEKTAEDAAVLSLAQGD